MGGITCLWILDTSSLSNICIVNIFSQPVTCLFMFLMMPFEE